MSQQAPDRPVPGQDDAESSLVESLRRGDEDAFERLVRGHGARMLAVAQRYLGRGEDARDAVQEAFIAAYRSIGSFQGHALLSTWLHQITVNACLMRIRSRKRRPEESIDDLLPRWQEDGHHVVQPRDWSPGGEERLQSKETCAFVRQCIDRLPESYRTVILLRDIEDMDTRETARLLGITESGAKVRLHRARQALRELLDERFGRGGR
ncbi:MAG TPA: sigma-70 family RNA polymerase sigma factor [Candidatus Polarisedimenticolia bacterium]|nr:sigma-70 family RNA polymerase sigma factor [Candidatus Polarisedimenticolia bacterium]